MQRAGVTLDPDSGVADGYPELLTDDPVTAGSSASRRRSRRVARRGSSAFIRSGSVKTSSAFRRAGARPPSCPLATRELTMQIYEEGCPAARAHKSFPALESKLLAIGGTRVVPLPDPYIDLLIQQGQVIAGEPAKKIRGRRCQCHRNVALRYLANPDAYQIATGYGLVASDGWWRQHSWLWDSERVLETTVVRDVYFGVVLDLVAAAGFVHQVVVDVLPELEEFLLRND
jgi:hypothetical protein